MGFTDHDVALVVAGVSYEPESGFDRSAAETRIGTSIDSMDLRGALSSERITREDVQMDLYQDAEITWFDADWRTGEVVRPRAVFIVADTEISDTGIQFSVEHKEAQAWNRESPATVTTSCRNTLGDANCRVVRVPVAATIQATNGLTWVETAAGDPAIGIWRGGHIQIQGINYEIARHEGAKLTVYDRLPMVSVGQKITLLPGCDLTTAMCNQFQNIDNFGGFDKVPPPDAAIRVARQGDGTAKAGGSLFG